MTPKEVHGMVLAVCSSLSTEGLVFSNCTSTTFLLLLSFTFLNSFQRNLETRRLVTSYSTHRLTTWMIYIPRCIGELGIYESRIPVLPILLVTTNFYPNPGPGRHVVPEMVSTRRDPSHFFFSISIRTPPDERGIPLKTSQILSGLG